MIIQLSIIEIPFLQFKRREWHELNESYFNKSEVL